MSIKKKLARLSQEGKRPPSADPRVNAMRAHIARLARQRKKQAKKDWRNIPGDREDTPWGSVQLVRSSFGRSHRHGRRGIWDALSVDGERLAKLTLDKTMHDVDPARAVFIDTETTGLAGGTGTLPFCVGLAFFEGRRFHVEQYLVRQPGEEKPALRALRERLLWASCMVSYNGKSYDWPLLRNRLVLNRVAVPRRIPHVDLLHCARRVFKRRIGRVRLKDLESHVLGFERIDDVEGADIPWIYWDFQKTGDGSELAGVVEHNAHDLVALAAILGDLSARYEEVHRSDDCRDKLSLAKVALRAGEEARALRFARAAARKSDDDRVSVESLLFASRLLRRKKRFRDQRKVLEEALDKTTDKSMLARVHCELAKLYEHRLKDLNQALVHARRGVGFESATSVKRRVTRLKARGATD